MPCYRPIRAWTLDGGGITLVERGSIRSEFKLSCGQCVGCRLERSRQWAVRLMHELSLHEHSMFVTYTYSDDKLPANGSLRYRDFQLYLKRVRNSGRKVRFFCAGEYGEETSRPHYHAIMFGFRHQDLVPIRKNESGQWLYSSKESDSLWTHGHTTIGEVTFESCAYVARYIMKKVTGDAAQSRYEVVSEDTGEVVRLDSEFCRMSLNPGIGKDWLRLYWPEVARSGSVVSNGVECLAPRYYRRYLDGVMSDEFQRKAEERAKRCAGDESATRLAVRERVARAKVSKLKRGLK